jgi:hypothetical protein
MQFRASGFEFRVTKFLISSFWFLVLLGWTAAAAAQPSPREVKQALSCAQSEGWFGADVAKLPHWRVASSQIVARSNRRIELMVYDRPDHGGFLEMEIQRNGPQRVFQLTNKAVFYFPSRAIVKFPEPPRGGLWALPDLVHLVQKMDRGPKSTITAAQLPAYRQNIACKGYSSTQASSLSPWHLR